MFKLNIKWSVLEKKFKSLRIPDAVLEDVHKLGEEMEQVEGIKLLDMFGFTIITGTYKDLGPKVHGILDNNYENNYGDDDSEALDPNYRFNKKDHTAEVKLDEKECQESKKRKLISRKSWKMKIITKVLSLKKVNPQRKTN